MKDTNLKTEYVNIPISMPRDHVEEIRKMGVELGISRNAAFCYCVRAGAPLVRANTKRLSRSIRTACRKIAAGDKSLSKILGTPANSKAGVTGDHDKPI